MRNFNYVQIGSQRIYTEYAYFSGKLSRSDSGVSQSPLYRSLTWGCLRKLESDSLTCFEWFLCLRVYRNHYSNCIRPSSLQAGGGELFGRRISGVPFGVSLEGSATLPLKTCVPAVAAGLPWYCLQAYGFDFLTRWNISAHCDSMAFPVSIFIFRVNKC